MIVTLVALGVVLTASLPSEAQHGNYPLGTFGLLGASQSPEGIYYQNIFSYYHASGDLLSATRAREIEGALGRPIGSVGANLKLESSIATYVDQNIIGMTTPFKILGANYGFFVDVPFAEVHGTGAASLDLGASLKSIFDRQLAASASASRQASSTASFNIADIYVEAINLGWHFSQLDVYGSFGFFAPSGNYDSDKAINNGLGRWAEMFGLGAVLYLDQAKTWSVSALAHYLTHQSQRGADIRVGDDLALEWGIGKTLRPASWRPWVAQLDMGVVGYAQWQVTDNRGSDIPQVLRDIRSNTFAVGPEIAATTRFGRFFARYEFEFGSRITSQGEVFLFGLALLYDPFKK